jgi:RNA 3'-terminal phosphate cyclase
MADTARKHITRRLRLQQSYEGDITIAMERLASNTYSGDSGAITAWASVDVLSDGDISQTAVLGTSGLLDRQSTPGMVAESAGKELCNAIDSGACVDSYMAEQIIMCGGCFLNAIYFFQCGCSFMGMANGTSQVHVPRPILHLTTIVDL